jgi:hypothetical protein
MSEMEWMHTAERIIQERSAKWVHPYTGAIVDVPDKDNLPTFTDESGDEYPAVLLDLTTASMLAEVWNNLSPKNQEEFATYGLGGAVELGWEIAGKATTPTQVERTEEQPDA